jgi:hypothetical protein
VCDFIKITVKIFKPLPQVKLLMFSKENSSEEISFSQPPKHKAGQWFAFSKERIASDMNKFKKAFR